MTTTSGDDTDSLQPVEGSEPEEPVKTSSGDGLKDSVHEDCSGETVIGSVEVSMSPSSRAFHFLVNPPAEGAYIANMAVSSKFRRRGFATHLLQAAEALVKASNIDEAYLHTLFQQICRASH